jgi:ABC-type Fe3+ transport system substrate-binding protein
VTTEVLAYATPLEAAAVRRALASACRANGVQVRLEVFGTGAIFQRLVSRTRGWVPDLVFWTGPYAAQSAAAAGLLHQYQPRSLPRRVVHAPEWHWSAVTFRPVRLAGAQDQVQLEDVDRVPRLALADPERSETSLMVILAVLDRARQLDGDVERGWDLWRRRSAAGMTLVDDDEGAMSLVRQGRASHALTLGDTGGHVLGLAPVPNAVSAAAASPAREAAVQLLDWLASEDAADASGLSAWRADVTGLEAALDAAPPLDIAWGTQQYSAVRRRWAQSGFGP